jgi:hypothetical protein
LSESTNTWVITNDKWESLSKFVEIQGINQAWELIKKFLPETHLNCKIIVIRNSSSSCRSSRFKAATLTQLQTLDIKSLANLWWGKVAILTQERARKHCWDVYQSTRLALFNLIWIKNLENFSSLHFNYFLFVTFTLYKKLFHEQMLIELFLCCSIQCQVCYKTSRSQFFWLTFLFMSWQMLQMLLLAVLKTLMLKRQNAL